MSFLKKKHCISPGCYLNASSRHSIPVLNEQMTQDEAAVAISQNEGGKFGITEKGS